MPCHLDGTRALQSTDPREIVIGLKQRMGRVRLTGTADPAGRRQALGRAALALGIGLAGGMVFHALNLPLPWMLGALCTTLSAAILGLPIRTPEKLRPPVIAVIGVLLGSGFTPLLLARIPGWLPSLALLGVYCGVGAALVVPIYRRFGGFDPVTAYFAGMPGGLAEMMMIGGAMGGDDRKIILAHAARIVITVTAIAFWFRLVMGYQVSGNPGGPLFATMTARDALILAACGVVGAIVATRLRLPAATLLGPMMLSGLAHASGVTASAPPPGLVIASQVALGTVMGCRFVGVSPRLIGRALILSMLAAGVMLALALAFAFLLHATLGFDRSLVLLAFAPGGLTEMSLVALAMKSEVAFVALHHVVRIVLVIVMAPVAFRIFRIG